MKITVNPGSRVEVEGSFQIGVSLADFQPPFAEMPEEWLVVDRETGDRVHPLPGLGSLTWISSVAGASRSL